MVGLTAGKFHDVAAYLAAHPGLPYVAISNPTGTREGRVRSLMRAIVRTRAELIVGVNIVDTYEAVDRLRSCGKLPEARCAMSVHGIQPDYFEDVRRDSRRLDGVVCTNRLAVELALGAGIASERVGYAQYGVPLSSAQLRVEKGRGGGVLRLAYVGRIETWQKRVLDLPSICEGLVERGVPFELFIAGGGPDERHLRELLQTHTSAGRIRWLGNVPAGEMQERVYSQVDVLLNLSLWETGPIVIWEAMSNGVAVVSSRYVGSGLESALVHMENCLLFDVGNSKQAAAMIESLGSASARERLVKAGHELLASRYNVEASVVAWEQAMNQILAQPVIAPKASGGFQPSGRLDSWLGVRFAESTRRLLRLRYHHVEPGGEWPHSYGNTRFDDDGFWSRASRMDQRKDNCGL